MALTKQTFITEIGNAAVNDYSTYQILPSLTIAQACLESSWGTSQLAQDCYNYFGMKWTDDCGTDYKEYSTTEQNSDGSTYTVITKFRKYSSLEAGIKGYYDFLQYERYSNLKGETNYKTACTLIRQDGWATDVSYTTKLVSIIESYDLTYYDKLAIIGSVGGLTAAQIKANIKIIQEWFNEYVSAGLTVDGVFGTNTKKGAVKAAQKGANEDYNFGLTVDGIWGTNTQTALSKIAIKEGMKNSMTKVVQAILYCYGYNPQNFTGDFGSTSAIAVREFKIDYALTLDGIFGEQCFITALS